MSIGKDLPIVGKFLLIIGLFGMVSVSCAVFSAGQMHAIDDGYTSAVRHQDKAAVWMSRATSALKGTKGFIADLMISKTDDANKIAIEGIERQKQASLKYLDNAKAAEPSKTATVDTLKREVARLVDDTCAKAITMGQSTILPTIAAAQAEYAASCGPKFDRLITTIVHQVDASMAEQDQTSQILAAMAARTIGLNYLVALGGGFLVSLLGFFAIRAWVSRPLNGLAKTMRAVAEGDLSASVAGTDRKDEIGPMARAIEVFKTNCVKLRETEAEADRQRRVGEEERLVNEAARAEIQRQKQAVVSSLAAGLAELADGNLTSHLREVFPVEYEKLRADFNATADSLRAAMDAIATATTGINSGSDQIANASDNLARRTEQQAASLEETAAALNLITHTVTTMATSAGDAAKVVADTRDSAEKSGQIVSQAVDAMGRIKDSSDKITQIIGVIDEIAFQTNLLALNAGVEAARAGEAGRGFAVVASEVRGLAQRSAEAAREIKSLISTSTVEVEGGVELVNKTGVALRKITEQVTAIDALVREISSSSKEQATGLAEINIAVGQMDQVVQQNAAMVEESTAAAFALKTETQDLSALIGKFKVQEKGGRALRPAPRVRAA